jgi:hypothetical protein
MLHGLQMNADEAEDSHAFPENHSIPNSLEVEHDIWLILTRKTGNQQYF